MTEAEWARFRAVGGLRQFGPDPRQQPAPGSLEDKAARYPGIKMVQDDSANYRYAVLARKQTTMGKPGMSPWFAYRFASEEAASMFADSVMASEADGWELGETLYLNDPSTFNTGKERP